MVVDGAIDLGVIESGGESWRPDVRLASSGWLGAWSN